MENILRQILEFFTGKKKNEDTFYTADEAFRKSLEIKNSSRAEFKKDMIRYIQREIRYDISSVTSCKRFCIVNLYQSTAEKEVLPEVAEYFREKGYEVDLKNGENYNETNILIVNWQNRNMFREEEEVAE